MSTGRPTHFDPHSFHAPKAYARRYWSRGMLVATVLGNRTTYLRKIAEVQTVRSAPSLPSSSFTRSSISCPCLRKYCKSLSRSEICSSCLKEPLAAYVDVPTGPLTRRCSEGGMTQGGSSRNADMALDLGPEVRQLIPVRTDQPSGQE